MLACVCVCRRPCVQFAPGTSGREALPSPSAGAWSASPNASSARPCVRAAAPPRRAHAPRASAFAHNSATGRARARSSPRLPSAPLPPSTYFTVSKPRICLVPGDHSPSSRSLGVPSGPSFHSGSLLAGAGLAAKVTAATPRPAATRARARPPAVGDTARALPGGCAAPARVGPGLAPLPPRARN